MIGPWILRHTSDGRVLVFITGYTGGPIDLGTPEAEKMINTKLEFVQNELKSWNELKTLHEEQKNGKESD